MGNPFTKSTHAEALPSLRSGWEWGWGGKWGELWKQGQRREWELGLVCKMRKDGFKINLKKEKNPFQSRNV